MCVDTLPGGTRRGARTRDERVCAPAIPGGGDNVQVESWAEAATGVAEFFVPHF